MAFSLKSRYSVPLIILLSVAIPLVVAVLIFVPGKATLFAGLEKGFLPLVNACINSMVTVLLITGFVLIRQRKIAQHKTAMLSAFVLSSLFLVSYVTQHTQFSSTPYPKENPFYGLYLFILFSHILLAVSIVPLALFSIYRGLNRQDKRHRAVARWTLPIWLYVSITGMVVYLMISPYYT
ncbi:MAG: DUF420 domain-containing protein [Bacteroidetes bacterium]|nr:DUF420 domain-containing protein [Bacteroidota bacterium]